MGAKYCDQQYVCLFAYLKDHMFMSKLHEIFFACYHVADAVSSSDHNAICSVLPVVWMMSRNGAYTGNYSHQGNCVRLRRRTIHNGVIIYATLSSDSHFLAVLP